MLKVFANLAFSGAWVVCSPRASALYTRVEGVRQGAWPQNFGAHARARPPTFNLLPTPMHLVTYVSTVPPLVGQFLFRH